MSSCDWYNTLQLAALVDPLTSSPLVGANAAYEASLQLCRSLGPALEAHAGDLAAALRLARLGELQSYADRPCGRAHVLPSISSPQSK